MTSEEAKEHYQELAQAGEYAKALPYLEIIANSGDPEAQAILGVIYDEGSDPLANSKKDKTSQVPQDKEKSFYWYEKAAQAGNKTGQHGAGMYYYDGETIPRDYKKALFWLEKAAQQGVAPAQHIAATCYLFGNGTKKDKSKARHWFEKAAQQGFPPSQKVLDEFDEL